MEDWYQLMQLATSSFGAKTWLNRGKYHCRNYWETSNQTWSDWFPSLNRTETSLPAQEEERSSRSPNTPMPMFSWKAISTSNSGDCAFRSIKISSLQLVRTSCWSNGTQSSVRWSSRRRWSMESAVLTSAGRTYWLLAKRTELSCFSMLIPWTKSRKSQTTRIQIGMSSLLWDFLLMATHLQSATVHPFPRFTYTICGPKNQRKWNAKEPPPE